MVFFWLIAIAIIYGFNNWCICTRKEIITSSNDIEKISLQKKNRNWRGANCSRGKRKETSWRKAKKERQKRITENSSNAYIYTEKIVKDNLKAPSTAKFSNQNMVIMKNIVDM